MWRWTDEGVHATVLANSELDRQLDLRAFDLDTTFSEPTEQFSLSEAIASGGMSACLDSHSLLLYLFGSLATFAMLQRCDHVDVTLTAENESHFL